MTRRLNPAAEGGYTMAAVMLVMLATSMLAGAAFAAVGADIPFTRAAQDRKQAYAAAEAGTEFYLYQLARDNDFWKYCDVEQSPTDPPLPVNLADPGDGRVWRSLSGTSDARYSIELLPANGEAACDTARPEETMIDRASGTFRIRSTGESRGVRRSVISTFRRKGFLDFLYFTDYESSDPMSFPQSSQDEALQCVKYRAVRNQDSWCRDNVNIQFGSTDEINGPLHTNDDLLTCGTPDFGRADADRPAGGPEDKIEITGPAPNGWTNTGSAGCGGSPVFHGPIVQPASWLGVPDSNSRLEDAALPGYVFYGQTTVRFDGNAMDVTTYAATPPHAPVVHNNLALPANGVVYVNKFGDCSIDPPRQLNYDDGAGCAVLTIRGTYTKSMTFGSEDDILIDGNLEASDAPGSDVVLGLIANRFVRVKHDVDGTCGSNNSAMTDVTVEAAILALNDSFVVDNYACGNVLGTLTVRGAIAQKFRGPVGTSSSGTRTHGYAKDYWYDDRLRYRNPPYFLDPISAAWRVVRNNEQVPPAE